MDVGLNIAAAGMLAEQVQEDQLANDLANASTPGFKASVPGQSSFGSLLLANTATGQQIGTIQTGVAVTPNGVDLSQAPLESTGHPLDFAISGPGFFAVRTPSGIQYTRNGQFSTSNQGLLVDQAGDEVLSQSGAPIRVGATSTVPPSALGVYNVANPAAVGNNNFKGAASGRANGTVEQGKLESSGVNPIETMISMTGALQAYQAGQQAVQTINQTMQESAASVGLVQGG